MIDHSFERKFYEACHRLVPLHCAQNHCAQKISVIYARANCASGSRTFINKNCSHYAGKRMGRHINLKHQYQTAFTTHTLAHTLTHTLTHTVYLNPYPNPYPYPYPYPNPYPNPFPKPYPNPVTHVPYPSPYLNP